jgi:hypothetical protein
MPLHGQREEEEVVPSLVGGVTPRVTESLITLISALIMHQVLWLIKF